ncbi:hypothetical protein HDC90_000856 [Pedobacter sp. AK013]|uniref:hypothetical protein n=1 Tax=Pedobacter sp. AK013 TaxID=2723071 RepID=UPI00160DE720|nr:hypothetical protein [Pedobacter sp. AK013]MBB6236245.1 hypothetical protein [Pedobacter sp. AK013]
MTDKINKYKKNFQHSIANGINVKCYAVALPDPGVKLRVYRYQVYNRKLAAVGYNCHKTFPYIFLKKRGK